MTGSIVDRLKSSFSRGSSFSNEDQMCFWGMNESSVSSLAVSSVVTFAKSPSDISYISRSVATPPPPENTTLSTTSSPASSTSSQEPSTEPNNNVAPPLFNPPSLVLVPPETKPYAQLFSDKSCDKLTTLLVTARGTSVPLTGSYTWGNDADADTEEQNFLETCSSSSSSGPGESGWSTGSDDMSSSKQSNGGGSVELMDSIVWIDERWFENLDSDNGGIHGLLGLEQRQALLGSERDPSQVYIGQQRRWAGSCLCCCHPIWERRQQDYEDHHQHNHVSATRDKEGGGIPSQWFRYKSLAD